MALNDMSSFPRNRAFNGSQEASGNSSIYRQRQHSYPNRAPRDNRPQQGSDLQTIREQSVGQNHYQHSPQTLESRAFHQINNRRLNSGRQNSQPRYRRGPNTSQQNRAPSVSQQSNFNPQQWAESHGPGQNFRHHNSQRRDSFQPAQNEPTPREAESNQAQTNRDQNVGEISQRPIQGRSQPRRNPNPQRNHPHQCEKRPRGTESRQNSTVSQAPVLTILQQLENYTKEWHPDQHHNIQPFTKLPRDLALEIMDRLMSPVDKVSLALTTKTMWEWTKDKTRLEQFDLPPVLPSRVNDGHGIIRPWPYFSSLRWKLLVRIEDGYWKICAGCLRLHPKTEFFHNELAKFDPRERYCRAPGLLQVCPHLLLTYKKCATLQRGMVEENGPSGTNKFSYENVDTERLLHHQCQTTTGPVHMTFGLQPLLTDTKHQLVFQQKFTIEIGSGEITQILGRLLHNLPHELPNLCPHRGIVAHCLDLLEDGVNWNPSMIAEDDTMKKNVTCKQCGSYFSSFKKFKHSTTLRSKLEFTITKHIGKGYALRKGKLGHADPRELREWIAKTNLANVIEVNDIARVGCQCRNNNCRKLAFRELLCLSPVASAPETRWKTAGW